MFRNDNRAGVSEVVRKFAPLMACVRRGIYVGNVVDNCVVRGVDVRQLDRNVC